MPRRTELTRASRRRCWHQGWLAAIAGRIHVLGMQHTLSIRGRVIMMLACLCLAGSALRDRAGQANLGLFKEHQDIGNCTRAGSVEYDAANQLSCSWEMYLLVLRPREREHIPPRFDLVGLRLSVAPNLQLKRPIGIH